VRLQHPASKLNNVRVLERPGAFYRNSAFLSELLLTITKFPPGSPVAIT
jgi:hypothetical protein